jgi:branched-chain amino acid transport system substrate-binding protein
VALAVVLGGAAACQESDQQGGGSTSCGTIKVGIFGAFTGGNSGLVLPSRDAAKLAVKKYNAANPNCQVTLVEADTEGSPDKAAPVATQWAADSAMIGVIGGHFSGETAAVIPTFESAGMPMVSPSATRTDLTTLGSKKMFHRVVGNDASQGPAAGRYIKDVLKAQKPFLVDDGSAYGAALTVEVKKILGTVAGEDKVQEKQTNFDATIQKVKTAGADVVFYGGYTNEAAPFLKQLRQAGVTAKFVGGDGINDPGFPTGAGATESEGALITCPCIPPPPPSAGTFATDFKAEYGTDPGVYSAEGYDAANVLLDAIKDGKRTRADVLAYVNAYNKAGVSKTIKFDASGEVDPSVVVIWMYKVQAGKIVPDQEIPKS